MAAEKKTFTSDFRRFFGRGLTILLPSVLTLWLLWYAATFLFRNVAQPINRGIRVGVMWVVPRTVSDRHLPTWYRVDETEIAEARQSGIGKGLSDDQLRGVLRADALKRFWDSHWYLSATGLFVAISLIYLAGRLLGGFLGRKIYLRIEKLIGRIPGFKHVYPHIKQLVDLIAGEKPMAFKRVVLVEYPRKGIWTLGLVTSGSFRVVHETIGRPSLAIFIPSTPTPFTGFTINVPEDEVVDMPITIDEAIRFVLTGGVLIPEHQAVGAQDPDVRRLAAQIAAGAPDGQERK